MSLWPRCVDDLAAHFSLPFCTYLTRVDHSEDSSCECKSAKFLHDTAPARAHALTRLTQAVCDAQILICIDADLNAVDCSTVCKGVPPTPYLGHSHY